MNSGNMPITVINKWIMNPASQVVYIDDVLWPENKPCARKVGK